MIIVFVLDAIIDLEKIKLNNLLNRNKCNKYDRHHKEKFHMA
jgi:hypothetical protein